MHTPSIVISAECKRNAVVLGACTFKGLAESTGAPQGVGTYTPQVHSRGYGQQRLHAAQVTAVIAAQCEGSGACNTASTGTVRGQGRTLARRGGSSRRAFCHG